MQGEGGFAEELQMQGGFAEKLQRERESRDLKGRLGNVSARLEQRESSETFSEVVHGRTVVGC
jgi:hypothetical protein